ncbi:hypothetical protein [Bosea sp. TAF32]|uniref:hypothetical protein n=1 Tax=Bosea sp. TAF32 TaxID=3237482 RepID=UPI003F8DC97C
MDRITIRIAREDERFAGSFVIEQGGKICDGLGWDEMLGQLAVITFPTERVNRWGGTLYPMETPQEREAKRLARRARGRTMAETEAAMTLDGETTRC